MHKISKAIIDCFERGNKVLICGNGGSMTQADHFAEELLGKFEKKRKALPAISLSNPSILSAIGNDFGFGNIFSRQVEGLAKEGDILITISTSGTSVNIMWARSVAHVNGIEVIVFPTNKELGTNTAETQETHLKLIHKICKEVENHFI